MWSLNSGTDANFPFGFMQLSTYTPNNTAIAGPILRWHQTNNYGYVPNESMKVT